MVNMFYEECLICKQLSPEPSHFWKEHRIKEADYCTKFYPRKSKLTGEPIQFKNREFYFNSDFNGKNELKKWVKENPDKALDYCLSIISNRFNEGKITYTPSQVELRSICAPNAIWYNDKCNYSLECVSLGLLNKYKYNLPKNYFITHKIDLKITIDTREQTFLKFPGARCSFEKLDAGDYWSSNSQWKQIYFERKNLTDFISTVSGQLDRFEREIERARVSKNFLYIIVEEEISKCMAFDMLPYVSKKIKSKPDFVFHRVRELSQKYNHIQFIFTGSRNGSVNLIHQIYSMDNDPTICDWQYVLDKKLIEI